MKAECKIGLEVEMEGGMWEMSPDNDEIKLVIWRTCLGLGSSCQDLFGLFFHSHVISKLSNYVIML